MTPGPLMVIPAYIYPGAPPRTVWDKWAGTADVVDRIIANPASGPGVSVDANYTAVIAKAILAGTDVFGYVDTNYGAIADATVKGQIDTWFSLYGIRNIFFDRTQSSGLPPAIAYHQSQCDYVHGKASGAKVILNPGTTVDEQYARMAETVIVFEGPYSSYPAYVPSAWNFKYPREKIGHLIYSVPDAATMVRVVDQAFQQHAGYIYVADAGSYFALPSFYDSEVAKLRAPHSDFTTAVYNMLEPLQDADVPLGLPLLSFVKAIASMFDDVDLVVRDQDGAPGWAVALDANNAPSYMLPWLGQWAGVNVDTSQDVPTQRGQILSHSGFARGTLAAMLAAGKATMTGSKNLTVVERAGDAWTVAFTGTTSEIPSVPLTLAAIKSQAPAGLIVTLNGTGGLSPNTTYAQVKGHGTYGTVKAFYSNYLDMKTRGA